MGVDSNAVCFVESVVCYDVCGLSSNARKGYQFFDGLRNLSAEFVNYFFRGSDDVFGFAAEKSSRVYDLLNICLFCACECFCCRVCSK